MKRIAADVWIPVGQGARTEAARDDVRGLMVAKALNHLSIEVTAYRAQIRHQLRKARGRR